MKTSWFVESLTFGLFRGCSNVQQLLPPWNGGWSVFEQILFFAVDLFDSNLDVDAEIAQS
jgi:hypothetical protein